MTTNLGVRLLSYAGAMFPRTCFRSRCSNFGHPSGDELPQRYPDNSGHEPAATVTAIALFRVARSTRDLIPARTGSETYLTEDSLARQQFGAQANNKAQHC